MATRVEELRDQILWNQCVPVVCNYQSPEGEVHSRTWRQTTKEDLDSLIAAARAEGAEQERERIRGYVDDPNNPHSMYQLCGETFWLKAHDLCEFVASGKQWHNDRYPGYCAVGDKGETGEAHT